MNTIAWDGRIGTADTRPYGTRHHSEIPTMVMKFNWAPTPEFDHYETTRTCHLLPRRAHAPTELVQGPKRRQEPADDDRLHATLLSYLDLPHDWDGYGAVPPSTDAVLDAVAFLVMRPRDIPLPFPQIASDGEVGVYWRTGEVHAEIGFCGDGDLSYYARYAPASGEPRECGSDDYRFDTGGWPRDLLLILGKLAP